MSVMFFKSGIKVTMGTIETPSMKTNFSIALQNKPFTGGFEWIFVIYITLSII